MVQIILSVGKYRNQQVDSIIIPFNVDTEVVRTSHFPDGKTVALL
jgi:hypothetical protein